MKNQAHNLKKIVQKSDPVSSTRKTKFITITSGKGGVGKSTLSANLGYTLASMGYKVGLFDADLGLANLDVILNVKTDKNILHLLKGEATLDEVIHEVDTNLLLIPGDSGNAIFKYSDSFVYERFAQESSALDHLDFILIDTGAGIGESVQTFVDAADAVVVVTTTEPAAITDAYAMLKIISEKSDNVNIIFNQVRNKKEAETIYEKLIKVAQKNIKNHQLFSFLGAVNRDPIVEKAIRSRSLFTKTSPHSLPAEQVKFIAKNLSSKMEHKVLKKDDTSAFGSFIKRILKQF